MQLHTCKLAHAIAHPGSALMALFYNSRQRISIMCLLDGTHCHSDYIYYLLFACSPLKYETEAKHFSPLNRESARRTIEVQNISYAQAVNNIKISLIWYLSAYEIPP